MKTISFAIVIVLACLVGQAGSVERAPFTQKIEEQCQLLPGERFSFKEILKTGKEARGMGALNFHGIRLDGSTPVAMIGVRSFLDGKMTLFLQAGDIFIAGNRYFKVVQLEKATSGTFAGAHVLTIALYTLPQ